MKAQNAEAEKAAHWNSYYSSKEVPNLPSQFAVFMLGEFQPKAVVDIGCGSGRDAFFFANQGIPTIGIDGSAAAVELCQSKVLSDSSLVFAQADVGGDRLTSIVLQQLEDWSNPFPIMLYARFFIHAINEDEESNLLRHARNILDRTGGVFAAEFRTTRDRSMEKVTPDHYRRFVSPPDFSAVARQSGFKCLYFVEGHGLAKYKDDDAYVARFILS